jgi:hypothetical protein
MEIIRDLCMSNGDRYERIYATIPKAEILELLNGTEIVCFSVKEKTIYINPKFIVSFEIA